MLRTEPENRPLRFVYLLFHRFLRHRVGMQSAALAFYLLFTLFPFLIFFSALLGVLQLDVEAILAALNRFLPGDVVGLVGMYLTYVGQEPSPRLMVFALVFSIYFPMRTANTLMRAVRAAYHLGPPHRAIAHVVKTLFYTVVLIAVMMLTLILVTVSDRLLAYGVLHLRLPSLLAELWAVLRFPVIGAVGFFALLFLYALSQDGRRPWRDLWPGTLAALGAWLALSWLYAWYVENLAHYSALYGSIGVVIVLLVWLNMTAVVFIMGAEFNGVLIGLRKEKEA